MWLKTLRSATFATAAAPLIVNPALLLVGATTAPFWLLGAVAVVAVGIPTVLVEKRVQLRAGQQELFRSLADVLQRIRNHLLSDVDVTGGRFSRVEEYFNSLEGLLGAKIRQLASQKLADAQAESDRFGEQSRLDDQARQERAEETRRQLSDWDGIGMRLREAGSELEALERRQGASAANQASS